MKNRVKIVPATIYNIKRDILSRGEFLEQFEAVGLCGSIVRENFNQKSDIDIFVIVKDENWKEDLSNILYQHFSRALDKYRRDITIILYPLSCLKQVACWQTLGMVSEGKILFDKGDIAGIFQRIKNKAYEAGLVEERYGNQIIWKIRDPKPGKIVKVELTD